MNNVAMTTSTPNALVGNRQSSNGIWNRLLITAGCYLIPYIPDLIAKVLDIPNQMMANDYALNVKKGDFELKFSKNTPAPATVGTEVQHEQN